MIKVTRVQTRSDQSIPLFTPTDEKAMYTINNFVNTGFLRITHHWSDDRLTKTSIWEWQDQTHLDEYNSNSLVIANKESETSYHNSLGISFSETIENI